MDKPYWWYRDTASQARVGPLSVTGLKALLASRVITPQTCIWCEGMPWWLPLDQVEDLESAEAVPAPIALPA